LDQPTRRRGRAAAAKSNGDKEAEAPRRQRGSTAVYEDMREDILSLKMAPGSALDEIALAKRFSLSRTPVREALLMLSRENLVTLLPNRSAIVTPHTMSNANQYMDTLVLLSRAVMRLAAEMRDESALREIRARREAYEEAARREDVHAIVAADLGFHRAISLASGNEFLGNFYRLSLEYGRRMHLLHYYPLFDAAERKIAISEHAEMTEALEQGDADGSEACAGQHVLSELRVVQRSLEPKVGAKFALGAGWRLAP
jgi:DNA-binding GntR family transcriptional regulator